MPPPVKPNELEFERERWGAEVQLRKSEIALKEREQNRLDDELHLKQEEHKRSRWTNPVVIAVLAAAVAAAGNAWVTWLNGTAQLTLENEKALKTQQLESEKSKSSLALEENRSEALRILEMIKTNDADKAAENLKFLLESGLISNEHRRQQISAYLVQRRPGTGTVLPIAGATDRSKRTLLCVIKSTGDVSRITVPVEYAVSMSQTLTQCRFSVNGADGLDETDVKAQCMSVSATVVAPKGFSVSYSERKGVGAANDCAIEVFGSG